MAALIEIKELHLHVNLHEISKDAKKILNELNLIKELMATSKADFQAVAQEFRDAFLNISNDITRLTDQLSNPGLSEADEAEVLEEFRTLAADAKALADRTPEPPAPQP